MLKEARTVGIGIIMNGLRMELMMIMFRRKLLNRICQLKRVNQERIKTVKLPKGILKVKLKLKCQKTFCHEVKVSCRRKKIENEKKIKLWIQTIRQKEKV